MPRQFLVVAALAGHLLALTASDAQEAHRILELDGFGEYVEFPYGAFDDLEEATIEAWVRWDDWAYFSHWFSYGDGAAWRVLGMNHALFGNPLQFYVYQSHGRLHLTRVDSDISPGRWCHTAATMGPDGMRLYLDGQLVDQAPYGGAFRGIAGPSGRFLLGHSPWAENSTFRGALDEVRVWDHVRSAAQIRDRMGGPLPGTEPGLAAYWNFDGGDARDAGPRACHGDVVGTPAFVAGAPWAQAPGTRPVVISARLVDESGRSLTGGIDLLREGHIAAATTTDREGRFRLVLFGTESFDVNARAGAMGLRRSGWDATKLATAGELVLRPAARISGRVTAMDGSPLPDVLVEAVRQDDDEGDGVAARTTTDTDGAFRMTHLPPGRYGVRCHVSGGPAHGLDDRGRRRVWDLWEGADVRGVELRVPPFKKGVWRTYGPLDGLAASMSLCTFEDAQGALWIGTEEFGLWRFDGESFTEYAHQEAPSSDVVRVVAEDAQGRLWVGTNAGVSQVVAGGLVAVAHAPLANLRVNDILLTRDGRLLLGTGQGVWAREGDSFVRLPALAALDDQHVHALLEDRDGALWIGGERGLWRAAADGVRPFSPSHRSEMFRDIHQSRDGTLWFATRGGVLRARNGALERQGVPSAEYYGIAEDRDGRLWFGGGGGVWCLDGESLLHFTARDGLAHIGVYHVRESRDGRLWFATTNGVSVYDPAGMQSFGLADGLPADGIRALHAGAGGRIWVGAGQGVGAIAGDRVEAAHPALAAWHGHATAFAADARGNVWMGAADGLWRFDGTRLESVPLPGPGRAVRDLDLAVDGRLWLATDAGVVVVQEGHAALRSEIPATRGYQRIQTDRRGVVWLALGGAEQPVVFDGTAARGAEPEQSWLWRDVMSLAAGPEGRVWFGTRGGVMRHDGDRWTELRPREGVWLGAVEALAFCGTTLFCATNGGGVAFYDGVAWSSLDRRDGLPSDRVHALACASGDVWIGTELGLARYRRDAAPPRVRIVGVLADRAHAPDGPPPAIDIGSRVTVEYRAVDPRTPRARRQYRTRIPELDTAWSAPTRQTAFEWSPKREGSYTFEVQAIDRHLNLSAPARLPLRATLPWFRNAWIVASLAALTLALALSTAVLGRRTHHQRSETARLREAMLEQERRDRRQLEGRNAQLEEAQRRLRQLLDQEEQYTLMLRGWAHAMKNPLTIAVKELEAQAEEADPASSRSRSAEATARVRLVRETIDRLLGAIVDLQPQEFHVREELELLLYRTVQKHPGIEFSPEGEASPVIRADFAKLRMAFENLFVNACQALGDGPGRIRLRIEAEGGGVSVEVIDDGPGIPADVLGKLLKGTYTTKRDQGGTGLGLLIARHIVEAHGGGLTIASHPGAGTTVRVHLPEAPDG